MPYKIFYKNDGEGVITTYTGNVTDNDLLSVYNEIANLNINISKIKYSVTDFTDIDKYLITAECIREQAHSSVEVSKINPNITVIVIAPNDVEYGTSRMWSAYSDKAGWEVKIFRTRDDANLWIKNNI